MKIAVVTQARYSSSRLPGKVLKEINNETLLEIHLKNAKTAKLPTDFIVATTDEPESIKIQKIAEINNWKTYRGSLNDVLDRYYSALMVLNPEIVVRITSDCPFVQGSIIDELITKLIVENLDYVSTSDNFPDGLDVEVFKFECLKFAWKNARLSSEREHVTPFIRKYYRFKSTLNPKDGDEKFKDVRITVDELSDFICINELIKKFGITNNWQTYCNYILENPSKFHNQSILRNEGYIKSLRNDANES